LVKKPQKLWGFVGTGINTGYKIGEDGKVNLEDFQHIVPLFFSGKPDLLV
jgi:hypothetical protein